MELSAQVAGLLAGHRHDEAALLAYLGAMMDASLPLDWYSLMLGRQGVHVVGGAEPGPRGQRAPGAAQRLGGLSAAPGRMSWGPAE